MAKTSSAPASVGYLGRSSDVIRQMAANRVWAWGITPGTRIFIHQSFPLFLMASTAAGIIGQARNVVLGAAQKGFAQGSPIAAASVVQDLALNISAVRSFGLRVTMFDSQLNYRPGWYHFKLSDGAGSSLGEVYVRNDRPQSSVEFMMCAIQSGGGQASIVAMDSPRLTLLASDSATVAATATTTTLGVAAETLNERDLAHA